jgi:hypothetical protein
MRMRAWSDEQVEQILGTLLRSGVIAAGAVVLREGFSICCNTEAQSRLSVFRGEPAELRSVSAIDQGRPTLTEISLTSALCNPFQSQPANLTRWNVDLEASKRSNRYTTSIQPPEVSENITTTISDKLQNKGKRRRGTSDSLD